MSDQEEIPSHSSLPKKSIWFDLRNKLLRCQSTLKSSSNQEKILATNRFQWSRSGLTWAAVTVLPKQSQERSNQEKIPSQSSLPKKLIWFDLSINCVAKVLISYGGFVKVHMSFYILSESMEFIQDGIILSINIIFLGQNAWSWPGHVLQTSPFYTKQRQNIWPQSRPNHKSIEAAWTTPAGLHLLS